MDRIETIRGVLLILCLAGCGGSSRSDAAREYAGANAVAAPDGVGDGSFAFSDSVGRRLIALDTLATPRAITTAICDGGSRYAVTWVRSQPRGASDDGRQTARNFENVPGELYATTGGNAPPDATCYLTADSALIAGAKPATHDQTASCDTAVLQLVAEAKHRQPVRCWLVAATVDLPVLAVQFAPADTSALASLVAVDGNRLMFQDFPARYAGPAQDTWRADDGGHFGGGDFAVLFIARIREHLVLAVTWNGAEGENSYLLAAGATSSLRTLAHSYRYRVPN